MDTIERNTRNLIAAIQRSSIYKEYKQREEKLMKNPELMARVDQFRSKTFQLQNDMPRANLFQDTEHLAKESADMRQMEDVNAYLDAELALCKLIQKICLDVTEGMDMHIPEI
ncbi:MAG: YlbF family regulator [Eubacteriales bacterium]|nr:YlbF family regulator [Eubacteriales bacterium]